MLQKVFSSDAMPKVAFGAIMMASSAMNNLFVTFYLDLFIHHAKLPSSYFFPGQSIYLLWNALNDPIFGFLQDSASKGRLSALRTRFNTVRYGGVAWAAAFLLIWFPPTNTNSEDTPSLLNALHFVLSICAYDAFLTLVELSHSSILSDITVNASERAVFNSYAAALAGFGSFSSFLGQYTWDRGSGGLYSFRLAMTFIAVLSATVFLWSARVLEKTSNTLPSIQLGDSGDSQQDDRGSPNTGSKDDDSKPASAFFHPLRMISRVTRFARELRNHPNFWYFVIVNCVQCFDCAFEKSTFAVMLERLSDNAFSHATMGLIISASFFLPWLLTLLLTPIIQQRGVYEVLKVIFAVRLLICFFGFVHSAKPESAAPFLLLNRVFSELVCRIGPLVISDLVDEDRFLHKRTFQEEARSGTLVGTLHFFTKIAASIGPMMSYLVITSTLPGPLLRLLFAVIPSICVSFQIIVWIFKFGLRGLYLEKVKEYVTSLSERPALEEQV